MGILMKGIILYSCVVSGLILAVSGILILLFSFNSYPMFLWLFIPWLCGCFGLVGLLASLKGYQSRLEAKTSMAALMLGIVGAVIFSVMLHTYGLPYLSGLIATSSTKTYVILMIFFPVIPILAGSLCIVRTSLWLSVGQQPEGRLPKKLVIALTAPVCLVLMRIAIQEGIIYWYGYDLADKAKRSAEQISQGNEYCLIRSRGPSSFEELNARKLISDALDRRFGSGSFTNSERQPHFGILVEGQPYWWSFREGRFVIFFRHLSGPSGFVCADS